jgi:polyhydroxybutyrate depolymerase
LDALPALVVYPDSLPGKLGFTAWQGAPYSLAGDQDVHFVSDLLSTIPSRYCVDETRVYAVGMSNGGAFATIVGCELGNQIKAVASISGAYYTSCAQEQRTPSLLVVHSTEDQQAPFRGVVKRQLPQVPQYVDQQVAARHCQTTIPSKEESLATYYSWQDCDDTSSLNFVVLHNQPHGWLALPQVSTQRAQGSVGYIWKFFEEATYNYQLF